MTARRVAALGAVALVVALGIVPASGAAPEGRGIDPVTISVKAPGIVARGHNFAVTVDVKADAGALDIAAQPLRLHVLLAPECGGSYLGSTGVKVMDRPLPAPATGAAYAYTAKGHSKLGRFGLQTVCVFVTDADERQYATSTGDSTVAARKGCTKQTKRLENTRKAYKNARGARRRALATKLKKTARAKKMACTPKPASA